MEEQKVEAPPEKPRVHRGWPKGKPRKPKVEAVSEPPPSTPRRRRTKVEAPVHVLVHLRGCKPVEFGCAKRWVENGFHVFLYPSKRDPYRETRKEIAISEVVEIEITEVRPAFNYREASPSPRLIVDGGPTSVAISTGPRIHSAKAEIARRLGEGDGPVKLDSIPGLHFGDSMG